MMLERKKMQKHYLEITKYFQKNFLLDSKIFRDLLALHPKVYVQDATVTRIERLAHCYHMFYLLKKFGK